MKHTTRFRAYSLTSEGASMSLSVEGHFTLIEARFNTDNGDAILFEMKKAGVNRVDVLHITSWDEDHCNPDELKIILTHLKPKRIEYPSYEPHADSGKESKKLIMGYNDGDKRDITPYVVKVCDKIPLKGKDIFYNPIINNDDPNKANDNSIVKLFRVGSFVILSTGDCEDENIANRLAVDEILKTEVDVLVIAHHGSKNSINTPLFLDNLKPRFAICNVDRSNKYDHPDGIIRQRLNDKRIPYLTTKDGDVLVMTVDTHTYKVWQRRKDGWVEHDDNPFTVKTYYPNDVY